MIKRSEFEEIAVKNGIKDFKKIKKFDLQKALWEKGLYPVEPKQPVKQMRTYPPDQELPANRAHLRRIRTKPRLVEVTDTETGETVEYPSIYRASIKLGMNPGMLFFFDGRESTDGKYHIKILDDRSDKAR